MNTGEFKTKELLIGALTMLLLVFLLGASTQDGKLITDSATTITTIDTNIDTVLEEVVELEKHVHSSNYVYGLNTVAPIILTRPSTVPIRVTGGTDAFGTAILLDKGAGAIAGAYYDPGKLQVVAVETANIPTIIRLYSATAGAGIAYTMEADDEKVTAAGIVEHDKLIFDTMVGGETHGVTTSIVYYALAVAAGAFQVSLTDGGAAVLIDADLSGNLKKLTATYATEVMVSMAATNDDSMPITFPCPRIASTSMLYCEARSHGASKYVDFFLDVHTYAE